MKYNELSKIALSLAAKVLVKAVGVYDLGQLREIQDMIIADIAPLSAEPVDDKLREAASDSARSMTDEEKKATDGFYLSHFKPEPVDDKALAEAVSWLQESIDCELIGFIFGANEPDATEEEDAHAKKYATLRRDAYANVIAGLRAAQQEVARLSKPLCKNAVEMLATAEVQKEVAELREWKRQCLEVWNSWDVQAVGKLLGLPLGKAIHPAIAPGIEALQAEVKELRKILGLGDVWPLPDVLAKLCDAVRHMKEAHHCDTDGHEQFYHALEAGEKLLALMKARPAGEGKV